MTQKSNGVLTKSPMEFTNTPITQEKESPSVPSDGGFDAIVCMGNSFAHLPDFNGDQREHGLAIQNFYNLVKPGGILMIDHRNYDYILDHGHAPSKNIYYNVSYKNCQNKVIMKKKH